MKESPAISSSGKFFVEACFSPVLYQHKLLKNNFITVVVDILRASTSICAALDHGVKEIIPVAGVEEAREYKKKGYIVACERDGKILDFADIGNSPSDFLHSSFRYATIAYSTTNGTRTMQLASDADKIVIGSFSNLSSLADWLLKQHKNVVILCAAWKNLFNLEDSVYAGALADKLLAHPCFETVCDSAKASLDLWSIARNDLGEYLAKSSHRNRLKHLVSEEDFLYTITPDTSPVVPVLQNGKIVQADH
ncbi:MAG: 2-phosphosulfolactate phosphatase [Cyclobacteriaceae bacterium]|nr:2-phosphosulfolactate phosphatase [Cyclobacteriaceae bacterium]